jgi:hypothetical protein
VLLGGDPRQDAGHYDFRGHGLGHSDQALVLVDDILDLSVVLVAVIAPNNQYDLFVGAPECL